MEPPETSEDRDNIGGDRNFVNDDNSDNTDDDNYGKKYFYEFSIKYESYKFYSNSYKRCSRLKA